MFPKSRSQDLSSVAVLVLLSVKTQITLRPEGGGVNVFFSVFTYVTELLKTNK